jgi:hypothetical protein
MGQLHFFGNCLLRAIAGAGMGVVLDLACDRMYRRLTKTSLHNHLARVAMILFQLMIFVAVAAMEIVYSPASESDRQGTVCSMFFEFMLFGVQYSFFERIQTLTKDV